MVPGRKRQHGQPTLSLESPLTSAMFGCSGRGLSETLRAQRGVGCVGHGCSSQARPHEAGTESQPAAQRHCYHSAPPPPNAHAFKVASIKVLLSGTWLLLGSRNVMNLFYCVESLELIARSLRRGVTAPHNCSGQDPLRLHVCSFPRNAGNVNLWVSGTSCGPLPMGTV